jgi:serine/threonine protein kinase
VPQADPYVGREIYSQQFRILERVGSGGMGAVYKALQIPMDRFVAVKILHSKFNNRKDLVSRFSREARAMSHLNHPNTAKVYLYGELEDHSCFIVMEYLDGKNLGQIIRREGPLDPHRAVGILLQACAALQEAHEKGIVHRDLKPENIFLSTQSGLKDFVKVLDFGLAKVTEREMRPGSMILTQEGMVFGTPEFMSPEQAQGKILDARSDIYSLAVILYEMLTGKLPFDAKSPMDYVMLHVQSTPIPIATRAPGRSFPPGLQAVIDKAMSKRPDGRYQSASEFAAALRGALSPQALRDLTQTLPPGTIPPLAHGPSVTDPVAFEATTPRLETDSLPIPPRSGVTARHPAAASDPRASARVTSEVPRETPLESPPRKTLLGISRGPGIALLVGLGVCIGVLIAVGVTLLVLR